MNSYLSFIIKSIFLFLYNEEIGLAVYDRESPMSDD